MLHFVQVGDHHLHPAAKHAFRLHSWWVHPGLCLSALRTDASVALHINQIERDIRTWLYPEPVEGVRRRIISCGARTPAGAQAWDAFLSLAVTARKLGISFYHYIYDRIAAINHMPSLAHS